MFKNKHFNAIVTKFLLTVTVLGLIMPPAAGINTSSAVVAAIVLTIVSYVAADLLVLPRYGNRAAVAADAVLAAIVSWEMAWVLEDKSVPVLPAALIVLIIGLGEWYYHGYLARLLFRGRMKP
ncbi:MAG: YndM family protein [Firmicutes bacterium]|nr:YndM family protein [Bacillota bacterium]